MGEGPSKGINGSVGAVEKKFSINFGNANTKFCLSLHYNGDESYLYVIKTEIYKFEVKDSISWYNLCLAAYQKILQKMNRVKFL